MADALTGFGVNINVLDDQGDSPLVICLKLSRTSTCYEFAQHLVQLGANVNQVCGQDSFPLMSAVVSGDMKAAFFLLRNGADIDKENDSKLTVLEQACEEKNQTMIVFLLNFGPKINYINNLNRLTPFRRYLKIENCTSTSAVKELDVATPKFVQEIVKQKKKSENLVIKGTWYLFNVNLHF